MVPVRCRQERHRLPDRTRAGVLERHEVSHRRRPNRRTKGAGSFQAGTTAAARREGEVMACCVLRLCAVRCAAWLAAVALAIFASTADAKTLRVVPHSDLKIVDPIWTTAYITAQPRLHDLRHAVRDGREGRDQAADGREVTTMSADKLTCTFTLRDGLSGTTASRSPPRTASPRSSAGARATRSARS